MGIEEKFAIIELCSHYAQHIDFFRTREWAGLFTDDGVLDESELGLGVHSGRGAILAYGEALKKDVAHAAHLMFNHLITFDSATRARGTVFALVEAVERAGTRSRYQIYYDDIYVKEGEAWLFETRIIRKTFEPEYL